MDKLIQMHPIGSEDHSDRELLFSCTRDILGSYRDPYPLCVPNLSRRYHICFSAEDIFTLFVFSRDFSAW